MNASRYYEPRTLGSHPAKCDACGKPVGMGDYLYLCSECFDKLPERIQAAHSVLIDYPKIRQAVLKDALARSPK